MDKETKRLMSLIKRFGTASRNAALKGNLELSEANWHSMLNYMHELYVYLGLVKD